MIIHRGNRNYLLNRNRRFSWEKLIFNKGILESIGRVYDYCKRLLSY